MCAMALLHARVKRVVFAASDPKTGAAGSVIDLFANARLNHHTAVQGGLMAEPSAALLREFFAQRRQAWRSRRSAADPGAPHAPTARPAPSDEPIPAGDAIELHHAFPGLAGMPDKP